MQEITDAISRPGKATTNLQWMDRLAVAYLGDGSNDLTSYFGFRATAHALSVYLLLFLLTLGLGPLNRDRRHFKVWKPVIESLYPQRGRDQGVKLWSRL